MAERCLDSDCHDNVTRLNLFMKIMGASVSLLLGSIVVVVLYGMAAEKVQNDKIGQIPVIQKDIENIKKDVSKIETSIKELSKQAGKQITKDDLLKLINAVKKGK